MISNPVILSMSTQMIARGIGGDAGLKRTLHREGNSEERPLAVVRGRRSEGRVTVGDVGLPARWGAGIVHK
jgi:hypothetical protein